MKIGIDLGGSHIGVGIIEGGEIVYKVEKDLQNYEKGTLNIIELIKKIISAIIKQYNKKIKDIELIGIACPGISENGIITNANNLDIENYSFKQLSVIIKQLLIIYHCNSSNGNLKEFNLSDRIGRLSGNNITAPAFIFTSVTGLKQKVFDFSGDL